MKNYLKIPILLVFAIFFLAGNAMALAFSSTGSVVLNPDSATTGTATFIFTIDDPVAEVTEATIEFDSDIFAPMQESDFSVSNPGDWATDLNTGANGYQFSSSSGSTVATAANDPIIIAVNYTLLDADMAFNAEEGTEGGWDWDEGQAWALSYTLFGQSLDIDWDTHQFSITTYVSGGSTAVPEPANMLLLGSGLMFLVFGSRKKLIK